MESLDGACLFVWFVIYFSLRCNRDYMINLEAPAWVELGQQGLEIKNG